MGAIAKRTGTTRTVNETVIPSTPTVISPSATELGEEVRTVDRNGAVANHGRIMRPCPVSEVELAARFARDAIPLLDGPFSAVLRLTRAKSNAESVSGIQ